MRHGEQGTASRCAAADSEGSAIRAIEPILILGLTALPAGADMLSEDGAPYEVCALCHGLDGNSPMPRFPRLAGQPAAYLERQVRAFRAGDRANDGGQMVAIVTELSEEEIPLVAAWFAGQPDPSPAATTGSADGAAPFAAAGCGTCHVLDSGPGTAMPRLASQHAPYLAKQMRDFRDGRRSAPPVKRAALNNLDDAGIDQIAAWLAARPRSE